MPNAKYDQKNISPLRAYRENVLRIRQAVVAERLKAQQGWVSQIELGKAALRFEDDRKAVADAYGIPLEQFDALFEATRNGEIAPVERRGKAVNRRGDLPFFPLSRKGDRASQCIPRFENVAAGFSGEVERSPELTYVREVPNIRGLHSILIRGDSMIETLQPHDLIIVQSIRDEGLELPPRGDNAKNSKKQLQQIVPDDELFVISLNDEGVKVKRLQYQGDMDWKLQIVSDNPLYRVHTVDSKDKVVFYARVIGIGGPVPDWGKPKR